MIKYQLNCDGAHSFEGWFRDSVDFDAQSADGLIECPYCGSAAVRKAIMAPAISRSRSNKSREARLKEIKRDMSKAMDRARDYVEKNFDYVGDKFPEEARKIHYGETDKRGIFGEASRTEVKELVEEGVNIAPLPGAKKEREIQSPKPVSGTNKKLN